MNFTAAAIAEYLQGEVLGDPLVEVNNISKIEEGEAGTLSFLANPKYNSYLYETEASIVLINKDFVLERETKATLVKVENAYESFASLLELYQQSRFMEAEQGISEKSSISDSAKIGKDLYLGDFSVIGHHTVIGDHVKIHQNVTIGDNVKIGDGTVIRSGVNIYYDSVLGKNCVIHSGVVIGAEGFGFAPQADGAFKKVPQVGNVILEDQVEVGANACIDRATLGSTIIRKAVKLDNLVQIAHNVEVGENTVIAALSGISGSSKIGKNCMIGGQVGVIGHVKIADGTMMAAQTGMGRTVKKTGTIWQGSPAIELKNFQKSSVYFKRLPELVKQIEALEKKIEALSK